jgi:hypothetical protein
MFQPEAASNRFDPVRNKPRPSCRGKQRLRTRPRNSPKRLRRGSMPLLSAVGIPCFQAGEDVKIANAPPPKRGLVFMGIVFA